MRKLLLRRPHTSARYVRGGHALTAIDDVSKADEVSRMFEVAEKGEGIMTFIPTHNGFMRLEDSAKLLRAIFPNYPSLEPCNPAPFLEPTIQDVADRSN